MSLLQRALTPQVALMAAALGLLAAGWAWFSDPDVQPMSPSEALLVVEEVGVGSRRVLPETLDFVSRPLLVPGRRPAETASVVASQASAEAEQLVGRAVEGLQLLGVFGSGSAQGVIVSMSSGERMRMVLGDAYGDWKLVAVEPRSAKFSIFSSEGVAVATDQLEMGVQ